MDCVDIFEDKDVSTQVYALIFDDIDHKVDDHLDLFWKIGMMHIDLNVVVGFDVWTTVPRQVSFAYRKSRIDQCRDAILDQ